MKRNILVGASALVLALGIAGVQAAPKKKGPVHHTAASLECSRQADAKGLHGKARHKFREACKRQARHASSKN
jgi:hypothetical protein